jgi:hypothetical protein
MQDVANEPDPKLRTDYWRALPLVQRSSFNQLHPWSRRVHSVNRSRERGGKPPSQPASEPLFIDSLAFLRNNSSLFFRTYQSTYRGGHITEARSGVFTLEQSFAPVARRLIQEFQSRSSASAELYRTPGRPVDKSVRQRFPEVHPTAEPISKHPKPKPPSHG